MSIIMRKIIVAIMCLFVVVSCGPTEKKAETPLKDNKELKAMHDEDQ